MIRSHFAGCVSEQGDMQKKNNFQRIVWGARWPGGRASDSGARGHGVNTTSAVFFS